MKDPNLLLFTWPLFTFIASVSTLISDAQSVDSFNPAPNNTVWTLAVQTDGKILVGGDFTQMDGQAYSFIARLNVDGTVDTSFNAGVNNSVRNIIIQDDGKIIIGGIFTGVGGQPFSHIARLNPDGTADTSFSATVGGNVYSMAKQSDGSLLLGGYFTSINGVSRAYIGRIYSDGTLDSTFNPGAGPYPFAIATQADGKIVVGGGFTSLAGHSRMYIGRLNADGSLDTAFNPGASATVYSLAVQPDGRILVGGAFTSLGGQSRTAIGRLNVDGSIDTSFSPSFAGAVYSLMMQADGKIFRGGGNAAGGGGPIARLSYADGSTDPTFNMAASGPWIYAIALQADGNIVIGGSFLGVGASNSQTNGRLARIINTSPATQSLAVASTELTWLRGGTSPEISYAAFESSTDGMNWVNLGQGQRISGGWQLGGVTVAANATVRARGYAIGGCDNGSAWFLEADLAPPPLQIIVSDGYFGFGPSGFGFNFSGPPGQNAIVEGSFDLQLWVPLQTNVLASGVQYFSDPAANAWLRRFYRLRIP